MAIRPRAPQPCEQVSLMADLTATIGIVGFARAVKDARHCDERDGFAIGIADAARHGTSANEQDGFAIGIDERGGKVAEHGKALSCWGSLVSPGGRASLR